MEMPTEKVNPDDRVQVRRLSVIEDTIAYGDRRGVYLITDTKTGREYIGVSGVGITETGSHDEYSGKYHHQVEDER